VIFSLGLTGLDNPDIVIVELGMQVLLRPTTQVLLKEKEVMVVVLSKINE